MTTKAAPPPPTRRPDAGRGLSDKRRRFVVEYLRDGKGAAAARRAGYHAKMAPALLALPAVRAAIDAGQREHLEAAGVSKARLLQELGRIALSRPADFFDPVTGDAKHPADLGDDASAALAGFEVLIKNAKAGDNQTDTIHKFRLWDKVRALELYMKHYGMLIEKVQITDERDAARVARLTAMRTRIDA